MTYKTYLFFCEEITNGFDTKLNLFIWNYMNTKKKKNLIYFPALLWKY